MSDDEVVASDVPPRYLFFFESVKLKQWKPFSIFRAFQRMKQWKQKDDLIEWMEWADDGGGAGERKFAHERPISDKHASSIVLSMVDQRQHTRLCHTEGYPISIPPWVVFQRWFFISRDKTMNNQKPGCVVGNAVHTSAPSLNSFFDASSHLYIRVCPSVRVSVCI